MAEYQLDATQLLCPMPVIKAQNMVRKLENDDLLTILATDPGAAHDLPSWIRINGHQLINCKLEDHQLTITLKVQKEKNER